MEDLTRRTKLTVAVCFYLAAALAVILGTGFSWRTLVALIGALVLWQVGEAFWETAFTPQRFKRIQIRIDLNGLKNSFQRARIYELELVEATNAAMAGMSGHGRLTFTWLEHDLFYSNTLNFFSKNLEARIELPSYGSRMPSRELEPSDLIELRMAQQGYELVLLTREERSGWPENTRGKGLLLLRLPYTFLWTLQGADPFAVDKKVREILAEQGLMHWRDEEVFEAWDYHNEYCSLHWWYV